MTAKQLKSLLIEYCEDGIVRRYSGRGMFGAECVGIVGNTEAGVLDDLDGVRLALRAQLRGDDLDAFNAAVERRQTDDMGRGIIVYFPSLKFNEGNDL